MSKSMVLRVCKADMSSFDGFIWPKKGRIVAPYWDSAPTCGNGLHGWFEAQGDVICSSYHLEGDARFLVLEVETSKIVHLYGKCKFPEAEVIFTGSREETMNFIDKNYPHLRQMPLLFSSRIADDYDTAIAGKYGVAVAGDHSTAISGYKGTAKVGKEGTASAGDYGTASAGDYGTAVAGDYGTATVGDYGIATARHGGTATAGHGGTATAGGYGTATVGNNGTAVAGFYSTAIAGYKGTAIAGCGGTAIVVDEGIAIVGKGGTASAGEGGTIKIDCYYNNNVNYIIGHIDQNGLKPYTKYVLDENNNFIEKSTQVLPRY